MSEIRNAKQEKFARLVAEGATYVEAHKKIGLSGNKVAAHRYANSAVIVWRVKELRQEAAKRNEVTVDSLIVELEEDRSCARRFEQAGAMVSATVAKGKLVGLFVDRVHHGGKIEVEATADEVVQALGETDLRALIEAARKIEDHRRGSGNGSVSTAGSGTNGTPPGR